MRLKFIRWFDTRIMKKSVGESPSKLSVDMFMVLCPIQYIRTYSTRYNKEFGRDYLRNTVTIDGVTFSREVLKAFIDTPRDCAYRFRTIRYKDSVELEATSIHIPSALIEPLNRCVDVSNTTSEYSSGQLEMLNDATKLINKVFNQTDGTNP